MSAGIQGRNNLVNRQCREPLRRILIEIIPRIGGSSDFGRNFQGNRKIRDQKNPGT
jgi:hypothetical protein